VAFKTRFFDSDSKRAGFKNASCARGPVYDVDRCSYILHRTASCDTKMTASFDLQHAQTQENIPSSLSVLPYPGNMGVALEFRCYHLYELRYTLCPIYFRLMDAIFDFQHAQTYEIIPSSIFVLPDPGNMGVAVGISILSHVYAEICATEFSKPKAAILDF